MRLRVTLLALLLLAGCSADPTPVPADATVDARDVSDVSDASDVSDGSDGSDGSDAAADADDGAVVDGMPMHFTLTPHWAGVRSVEVYGSFGRSDDWTRPFLTLAFEGGVWSAHGTLRPGTYPHAFRVTGDDAAGASAPTFARWVHDPLNLRSGRCPTNSPLAMQDETNPCAVLFVPQSKGAVRSYTVSGRFTAGSASPEGWLAVIERVNPAQAPIFVDRVTVGPEGRWSVSLASGQYRVVAWNPTALSMPATARRVASASQYLSADTTFADLDVTAATAP